MNAEIKIGSFVNYSYNIKYYYGAASVFQTELPGIAILVLLLKFLKRFFSEVIDYSVIMYESFSSLLQKSSMGSLRV